MTSSPPRRTLDGARVLVVGATGGLGRPLTAALAASGARLALAGRDVDALGALDVSGGAVLRYDLGDTSAADAVVADAATVLGGLDGVVCCAGAVAFGPLDELPTTTLEDVVAVDLVGPLALARAAVRALEPGGFVLNVSGVVAELPTAGLVAYSAAKAGVSAGFRALAREVRARKLSAIDARPPHMETDLAARALHGEPPRMPAGVDPRTVAARLVQAIEQDERELPASAFAA